MDQDLQPVTVQAVNDAVGTQLERVHILKDQQRENADAILSEWIESDGSCLLVNAVQGKKEQYVFFYASEDLKETGDLVILTDEDDEWCVIIVLSLSGIMKLTKEQKVLLAQRVYDSIERLFDNELDFHVESMKDNDEMDWSYHVTVEDREEVYKMLQDLIVAVTVE